MLNLLPTSIIILCSKFLKISEIKLLRECCIIFSNATRKILFECTMINSNKLENRKLINIINQYNLSINIQNFQNTHRRLIKKIKNRNNVKKLIHVDRYNVNVVNLLPCLETLILLDFDKGIKFNTFPSTLTTLEFSDAFNQKIGFGSLPINLTTLKFGAEFNQELKVGVLPINLKNIYLGFHFNQKIQAGTFPENLEQLYFSNTYSQIITKDILPLKLKKLFMFSSDEQKIESNFFPSTLEYLHIGCAFKQILEQNMFPPQLKTLVLSSSLLEYTIKGEILPTTLIELIFNMYFIDLNLTFSPPNLQKIYLTKMHIGKLTAPDFIKINDNSLSHILYARNN